MRLGLPWTAKNDHRMNKGWLGPSSAVPPDSGGMREAGETGFGGEVRRRLVEEFAVSFYNGALKPNLAEKNPMTGREIEFLMDGPQFERTKRSEIWSYSNAVGTGYQYRVVYRDKRFSDLERLLEMYSGAAQAPEGEGASVERRLYEEILALIREGRLPKTFKIPSARYPQEDKIVSMVEDLGQKVEDLGRRVRKLEEQLAAQESPKAEDEPPQLP